MRAGCGRVPLTLSSSSCHRICPARHSPAPPSNWVQGGSNPFQGLILNRLFQLHIGGTFFIFKEEVQSNSSCYHPSECGRASWGRVVAGYAPNSPAPPPDYSFLDRVSARWRSESSTIQDTDQRQPELGESQEASLKIWARKMKIETFKWLNCIDEQTVGDKILAFPESPSSCRSPKAAKQL